jgi:RNA polymerase sigma-B factor
MPPPVIGDDAMLTEYAARPTPQLLDRLVRRYQPLARSLARRYASRNEPLDDLFQVANLALVKALNGYDPAKGWAFTTYATPTILGEIRRHFRDHVWNLRLPRSLQESTMKVDRATETLSERLGRSPTIREVAEETGLEDELVAESLVAGHARWTASLEAPAASAEDDGVTYRELLSSNELGFDRVEADLAVASATLDSRELDVLWMRFRDELTQSEIGAKLGISQMQVSRISRRAMRKLLGAVQGEEPELVAA